MDTLCQFGPIKVLFQALPHYPMWPFWRWKLDSFIVEDGKPDVVVNYSGEPIVPTVPPTWEDIGPQVCRQFYLLDDERIIWQQTERTSGDVQLQFTISADRREITLTQDNSNTVGMGAFEALTFLIYYTFLHFQVLTFHGVLVETDGKGFLLVAPSGVGKTTHARLWRDQKNALIINGDKATCFEQQGQWFGFGTPWCGTSGEYLNRRVPLQAVVILQRGEENRVYPVSATSLLSHIVYPSWSRKATETMLSLLDSFLEKIPILRLECTPEISAVDVLQQALERLSL